MKFVLITESGSDIPRDYAQKHNIAVVPMHVTFGDKTLDDGTFPITDIFDHYKQTGELPKTSGSTPKDFEVVYDKIHKEDPEAHILYIAYSAVTTCSYESALIAAQGRDYITCFDTKFVTAAEFLIIKSTVDFLESNPNATIEEIIKFLEGRRDHMRMAFIPGGLEFLKAGGRLSNAAYLGAQLLRIKPTIEVLDGQLVATKKRRGAMDKCVPELVKDFITREPMDKSIIGLIWNPGLSESIQREVEQIVTDAGFKEYVWIETGGVIASHCGPGSFGIAAFAQ